ncbi:MAG: hypothetical protein WDO73_25230 [Ignavibacteriota bacterium]
MIEKETKKNLGLRGSKEDHKRLRQLSVDTGKSVQRLFEEAMDLVYWHPAAGQLTGLRSATVGITSSSGLQQLPSEDMGKEEAHIYRKVQPLTNQLGVEFGSLTEEEKSAIELLLSILRKGSEIKKSAIISNLHAFTEVDEIHHGPQGSDLSNAVESLVRAAEKVGADQKQLGKWLEDLRRVAEEARGVRETATGGRGDGGTRATGDRSGSRKRG